MKTSTKTRNSILLLIAALFWGFAFVVQSVGGKQLGAYTFNSFRMIIGALAVFCVIKITEKAGITKKITSKAERKHLWITGLLCGVFLTIASNLQQVALNMGANTGKAGFLTALYIIIVPLIGLIFKQRPSITLWIAVAVAVAGMYFMCIQGSFSLSLIDLLLIACAVAFALQIMTIDRFGSDLDGLKLSCIQFIVTAVLSFIPALLFEIIPYDGGFTAWLSLFTLKSTWISLLYMGIFSCALGYTLQIIGMKGLNPTLASLLMSFESVFALVGGLIFLHQGLSIRETIGCILVFLAICLAQINIKPRVKAEI